MYMMTIVNNAAFEICEEHILKVITRKFFFCIWGDVNYTYCDYFAIYTYTMWLCIHLDIVCQLSLNKTGKKTNDVQAKDILGEQIGCHHILESCCIEEVRWLPSFSRPPEEKWVKLTKINFTSKLKKKRDFLRTPSIHQWNGLCWEKQSTSSRC